MDARRKTPAGQIYGLVKIFSVCSATILRRPMKVTGSLVMRSTFSAILN
ncbi:unnamed protein product [Haemonchus placei]|uniref:Uncharacterized protein n=1 Tax=Haemonchus placei TaxID=6290 RepID=A0A0N4X3L6_HAEPC|nr:unnamed protein product [Haemonchus placei]